MRMGDGERGKGGCMRFGGWRKREIILRRRMCGGRDSFKSMMCVGRGD